MNKPIAWIIDASMTDCDDNFIWNTGDYPDWQVKDWIPLYTHPVKELTQNITGVWRLSDQSIQIVFTSCRSASEFVEILRKAQEKC